MYKLESYVTNTILTHVAKYVKDIKPEDAQVSLWQGEVSFQNLDLRLDVLEEEMNLPIELKTGHIHDLTIQVPWTRITSEATKILINTIEFVVKLRKDDGTPLPTKKIEVIKDETEPQQSMLMGMVNKVLNNINIEMRNIIFKFLEDEFVASMHIQKILLTAANENWQSAVIDINPVKVELRKLIQINDMTISLDPLNKAGVIEVSHEPLLYRCSSEVRFLKKYNVNTMKTSSKTRIGILSKSLNVLLSSVQFPLAMKAFDLAVAVSSGEIKVRKLYEEEPIEIQPVEAPGPSYLSRAWNMLPSLSSPKGDDTNEPEVPGHLLDIGFYLEALNITYKESNYIHETRVETNTRIRYQPVVKVTFNGLYFEQQTVPERDWFSLKTGMSRFCIEPLGKYKQSKPCVNRLAENAVREMNLSFKDKSLFDKSVQKNENWVIHNVADYNERISDTFLLNRCPFLSFDFIKFNEASGGQKKPNTIETNSNQRGPRHMQFRMLSAGMTFRYNQQLH